MKSMKQFKDDGVYGECCFPEPLIRINVERIWWETKNYKSFVTLYSDTIRHEIIHSLINDILFDIRIDKEEEIIRCLTGEREHDCTPKRLFQVLA